MRLRFRLVTVYRTPMKAKTLISPIIILVVGYCGWMSVQMARQGFTYRRIAAANGKLSPMTLDAAAARLSSNVPAVWAEFSGSVEASQQKGWAWLSFESDARAVPIELKDAGAPAAVGKPAKIHGMLEPMTKAQASTPGIPPAGHSLGAFVLREAATPPGWFAIWGRIVGGILLSALLGLIFLGNVLSLFGIAAAPKPPRTPSYTPPYGSGSTRSIPRSEVRTRR